MSKNSDSSKNNDGFDELEAQFFQQGVEQEQRSKAEARHMTDEFAVKFATDVTIDDLDDIYMPVDSSEIAEDEAQTTVKFISRILITQLITVEPTPEVEIWNPSGCS